MTSYRSRLPQLGERLFISDGGLETTLIYHDNVDLPHFAAFDLINRAGGKALLDRYFIRYIDVGRTLGVGVVLESATWRANPDWASKLGYDAQSLADVQRKAIDQLVALRRTHETPQTPIVVSGNIGPRGDGYRTGDTMTAAQAEAYHGPQVRTFASTDADMVAAFTMNYAAEAIGVASAARAADMPVALSFTVETDGRLPSGESLADAIAATDAATNAYPAYYMINCAHPTHFRGALEAAGEWRGRLRGIRANASKRSHAELDASTEIDIGDPDELARDYRRLQSRLPHLTVAGGCCGTDHRHVDAICRAMLQPSP
jgi:S-methylmethionine-dependent homocysteine/selenocysteine methylase